MNKIIGTALLVVIGIAFIGGFVGIESDNFDIMLGLGIIITGIWSAILNLKN